VKTAIAFAMVTTRLLGAAISATPTRIEGRAGCLGHPPDHSGPATIIRNGLLGYVVGSLISEGGGEDEHGLVTHQAPPDGTALAEPRRTVDWFRPSW
jgi:hypothetical protein